MYFRQNILQTYLSTVPIPLALERVVECEIYKKCSYAAPILDIGCGEGVFAKLLFQDMIDTGVDPNPKEIEKAKEIGAYHELLVCKGDSIPKPDNSYMTIISNSVLEHIPNIDAVLKEIYRLLIPGGRFYFTVPSNYFDRYTIANILLTKLGFGFAAKRYRKFFNSFWKHFHYYSLSQWEHIVVQHGFEIIDAYTYNPRRNCLLNDFLIPFSFPGFVIKKITNRWILFPKIRRYLMSHLSWIFFRFLPKNDRCRDGGLVFIALTKNDPKRKK